MLADENEQYLELKTEADLAGLPQSLRDAAAARLRKERRLAAVGDREHALVDRAVPDLLDASRSSRKGVAHVRQPRRQRRRARQQRDHHRDPSAARRTRQAARLSDPRPLAPRKLDGQDAGARDGADGGGVEAGGRARARGSRGHAGVADKEKAGIKIEPWDYRYYAEKVRKAKYDLDQNEVKPYLQLEKLREGMFWVAGELFNFSFTPVDRRARLSPGRARLGGDGQDDRQARRPLVLRSVCARRQALGRVDERLPQPGTLDGEVTTIVSNNANFVKGKPGEPVLISWDDATTLFHEFGHALHGLSSNVTYPSLSGTNVAARLRRVPFAAARALARDAGGAAKVRAALPDRQADPAGAGREDREGLDLQPGLRDGRVPGERARRHEAAPRRSQKIDPDAFEKKTLAETRHAAGDRDAPPHAAVRPRLRGRRLFGRATTAISGRTFSPPTPSRRSRKQAARTTKPSRSGCGNTSSRSATPSIRRRPIANFRGRDPKVEALMRKRGFPCKRNCGEKE